MMLPTLSVGAAVTFTCDECGRPFAPASGGTCAKCGRTLCGAHLFGVFGGWRRLSAEVPVCVTCRRADADRESTPDGAS
jgi:hypothetical protein